MLFMEYPRKSPSEPPMAERISTRSNRSYDVMTLTESLSKEIQMIEDVLATLCQYCQMV